MTAGKDIFHSFMSDMAGYSTELRHAYFDDDWDGVYESVSRIASACVAYLTCVDMDRNEND